MRTLPDQDPAPKYQVLLVLIFHVRGCLRPVDAIGFTGWLQQKLLDWLCKDHRLNYAARNYMASELISMQELYDLPVYPPKEVDATTNEISETLAIKQLQPKIRAFRIQAVNASEVSTKRKSER